MEEKNRRLLKQNKDKTYTFLNCRFWDVIKFVIIQKLTGNAPRQEIK